MTLLLGSILVRFENRMDDRQVGPQDRLLAFSPSGVSSAAPEFARIFSSVSQWILYFLHAFRFDILPVNTDRRTSVHISMSLYTPVFLADLEPCRTCADWPILKSRS